MKKPKTNFRGIIISVLGMVIASFLSWSLFSRFDLHESSLFHTLTLFTLPLLVGGLLSHSATLKKDAKILLLSSGFLILGFLFIQSSVKIFETTSAAPLLIGMFLFVLGTLRIIVQVLSEFELSTVTYWEKK